MTSSFYGDPNPNPNPNPNPERPSKPRGGLQIAQESEQLGWGFDQGLPVRSQVEPG